MLEYRQLKQIRATESRSVNGLAVVFESESEDLGFVEVIHKGAITTDTINKSDIFATLDHDTSKILARSKYGKGSLNLSLTDEGLEYNFDAPNTSLGDELLEYLNRGEIDSSSFAFSLDPEDETAQKWERIGDKIHRHIFKIDRLYDISPVFVPAYSSTSASHRNKPSDYEQEINKVKDMEKRQMTDDEANELQALKDELEALKVQNIQLQEELKKKEEKSAEEEEKEEPKEEPKQEDTNPEQTEDKPNEEPEQTEDKPNEEENKPAEETADEDKNTEKNNRNNMKKNFSIVAEIRKAIENGTKEFNIESRALTVDGYTPEGEDVDPVNGAETQGVIEDETKDILEPLYAESVLSKIGARFYTSLPQGNIVVPKMGKGSCDWSDEIAEATESMNTFETITLKPNRLTAYTVISNKLLAQDTLGIEAAVRRDILNALNDKLEATVLGTGAKGDNKPAGIFNGKELQTVDTYGKLCDAEAIVEENNYTGNMMYVVSPKAKAKFRQMAKSAKSTQLVLEGGTVDGTPVICTSNVPANKFVYGNFNDLIVGLWGGIQVIVDPYTLASKGCTKIVINAYADAKIARADGMVFGTVA